MHDETGPGAYAARQPEDARADRVPAVGVGPGAPAYLTRHAHELLAAAEVVVGFESVLAHVADVTDGELLACAYDDQTERLATFAERVADGEQGVAALMGDPNVSGYQFLGRVERALERGVRVVPGISSIQVAASRARTPLEDTTVVTLHERGDLGPRLDRLAADAGERHLLVLPRYDWMPERIAAHLVETGGDGGLTALVCERLTHDEEVLTRTTLGELTGRPEESAFSDLSVLVVRGGR